MTDYRILSFDDFDETERRMLSEAIAQAERGYTDDQLARARRPGPSMDSDSSIKPNA